jgi:hypothetical protein
MLPFLKNQKEGGMSGPVEIEIRKTQDEDESYEMLDAIADDIMHAFEHKDRAVLKGALEALCGYIQEQDEIQDHEMEGEE